MYLLKILFSITSYWEATIWSCIVVLAKTTEFFLFETQQQKIEQHFFNLEAFLSSLSFSVSSSVYSWCFDKSSKWPAATSEKFFVTKCLKARFIWWSLSWLFSPTDVMTTASSSSSNMVLNSFCWCIRFLNPKNTSLWILFCKYRNTPKTPVPKESVNMI